MKALKLVFTLCIFSLALSTSFAQTIGDKSEKFDLDRKNGGTLDGKSCDDVFIQYWDMVIAQSFTDQAGLDQASGQAMTRFTQNEMMCFTYSSCGGALNDLNMAANAVKWSKTSEYVGAVQKVIGGIAKRHPNCLSDKIVSHITGKKAY